MLLKHRYQGGGPQDECVGSLYWSVWQLQFSCRACTQVSLVQLGLVFLSHPVFCQNSSIHN